MQEIMGGRPVFLSILPLRSCTLCLGNDYAAGMFFYGFAELSVIQNIAAVYSCFVNVFKPLARKQLFVTCGLCLWLARTISWVAQLCGGRVPHTAPNYPNGRQVIYEGSEGINEHLTSVKIRIKSIRTIENRWTYIKNQKKWTSIYNTL